MLFRPPYGQLDAFGEQAIAERHLGLVLWSVEAADMRTPTRARCTAASSSSSSTRAAGSSSSTTSKWPTVHVLARLLDWLDAKKVGYEVVDLARYLTRRSRTPIAPRSSTRAPSRRGASSRRSGADAGVARGEDEAVAPLSERAHPEPAHGESSVSEWSRIGAANASSEAIRMLGRSDALEGKRVVIGAAPA